ncbi:MAG: 1-deoxy-D-xylulose-5-phosphate reductoisomerase [Flavobacteriales bacterium]|nr:1-deoxy-D-xylulose-5-phosphate reductoisomerase [Flavobacteriales bacterium]
MTDKKRNIAILGSTGSIGTQALEVIGSHPDKLSLEVLTAGSNFELLAKQAIKFQPNAVVISDESKYKALSELLADEDIKIYAGEDALNQIVGIEGVDVVLTAIVGYAGLKSTMSAILAGKTIALANKEALVVAGELVTSLAQQKAVDIYPVDSEHSAIFQCLTGEIYNPIEKIYLTASGGPFRGKTLNELQHATKAQALNHPNWSMGAKITIDSATMMNKGLEAIEAKWLFGLKPDQIDVVIHPQSIIHSMVQFEDGSIKAQMGLPDMKLPIQYAFTYPIRLKSDFERLNFKTLSELTFESPDKETFRNLALAYDAMEKGGNAPCVLNASNEIAVDAFLNEKIGFLDISHVIEKCIDKMDYIAKPSIDDYIEVDTATRIMANEFITKMSN